MKKAILLIVAATCLLSMLSACSSDEAQNSSGSEVSSIDSDVSTSMTHNSDGIQVGDSLISWANMELDNPELNLTPEQLAVVKYFDNDYFSVGWGDDAYDAMQRYPQAYRGAQIYFPGMIIKILTADDEKFECLVEYGRVVQDQSGLKENQYLIVRGKQPTAARVTENDIYSFYGRYIDIEDIEVDGSSGQYPVVSVNYFVGTGPMGEHPRFDLDTIQPVAKMMLGDDVKLRDPEIGKDYDLDELHWPQYSCYIVTPGNQANDNFASFEFSRLSGMVRDTRATVDVMRTFNMAADFQHYYLSIYDSSLELFYLECYDRDYQKVWGREFHNVDTVPYDYTCDVIYLAADNDLYIIDAKTGEDKQEPVMVGQKVKISLLPDGAILVGEGDKDNIMKVDLSGEVLWKVSADIDVTSCDMLQVVDGRVIANLEHWEVDGIITLRQISVMAVVDESGSIVSEFTVSDYNSEQQISAMPTPSSDDSVVIVNATDGLNLRAGPGSEYESLGLIPDGSRLTLASGKESHPGWLYVAYGSMTGYVSEDYVVMQ